MKSYHNYCPNGLTIFFLILIHILFPHTLCAQPEVHAWGNLKGIRIDGRLIPLESSLTIVEEDWSDEIATGKERFSSTYNRVENTQVVQTRIDSLFLTQRITDEGKGIANLQIEIDSHQEMRVGGVFFHLKVPSSIYSSSALTFLSPSILHVDSLTNIPVNPDEQARLKAKGIELKKDSLTIRLNMEKATSIIVQKTSESNHVDIYITLASGTLAQKQPITQEIKLSIEAASSSETAILKLYPAYPGQKFLGLGGNFRLQNPQNDPKVIDYCLNHLEVRMSRVELPWSYWHPNDSIQPLAEARKGNIHPHVKASMEMAQRLYDMDMPVLLAAWFPPSWAAIGEVTRQARNPDGTFGNPLRPDKREEIYASLTDYMIYLKEAYGVEVDMFSFNESDLGINVRQTSEEHAELIKGLGTYMEAKGLSTKLLLGDTADANGFDFVNTALGDPETWPYIGAVSFHSWRGWDTQTLFEWYEAADRLNVPLIVGEGSIDAAAWRYPNIFKESIYAIEEIKLYTRLLAICQPQSILQWQLTSDYSPLVGAGVYGSNPDSPLTPTQRFWNLKQFSTVPSGLSHIPIRSNTNDVHVAALGDVKKGTFVFHIVNEGNAREVLIHNIPKKLKQLRRYVTDHQQSMEEKELLSVRNGELRFMVEPASFTSLMTE